MTRLKMMTPTPIMPPLNLPNYHAHRDWFDNALWLKQHSKETANRAVVVRVAVKKPSDFMGLR
jgi:hypothetical protein